MTSSTSPDQLRVERRGRLVEQHGGGLHGERAGDGGALLLAARQLGRIGVELVGQADPGDQRAGRRLGFFPLLAFDDHRSLDDVLQHRLVREEVEALEHHAEAGADAPHVALAVELAAAGGVVAVADQHVVEQDLAGLVLLEEVEAAQQRRLARAARPDDGHYLAALDLEADAAQHFQLAEALVQAAHLDQRGDQRSVAHRLFFQRCSRRCDSQMKG